MSLEEGGEASLQPQFSHETGDVEAIRDQSHTPGLQTITDTVTRAFRLFNGRTIGLESRVESKAGQDKQPNLVVVQVTGVVPSSLDIVF